MTNYVQSNTQKKGLTVKDLITIGVFTAIIYVCNLLGGTVFAITPTLTFYFPIGAAVFAGPVYLLLIAKVPKRGPIMIMGILGCIIGFMTGMHWAMEVSGIIAAILADFVAGLKNYRSKRVNIISYIVYAFGTTGTYFAYFINPQAWISSMLINGTTQEYINTMQASANEWVLVIMIVGTILVSGISGLVGSKLLKKQFEKAGITA